MIWRLCCILVAAIAVWQTHAKPLIEEPTFSEIDLDAEESQQNAVYVATATRTKRHSQFFGPHGFGPPHFGGPPGFNNGPPPPHFGGHPGYNRGPPPPHFGGHPGYNRGPPPPHPSRAPSMPVQLQTSEPTPTTYDPSFTPAPPIGTPTNTATSSATTERAYDIDVRFGN